MLEDFLQANNLGAKLVSCSKELFSAKDIAEYTGVSVQQIIKSVLFIDSTNYPILVVLYANREASQDKMCKALEVESVRQAFPEEVEEITGYQADFLPPISIYGIKTLLDKKLFEQTQVVNWGGSKSHLLQISPSEIEENSEEVLVDDFSE